MNFPSGPIQTTRPGSQSPYGFDWSRTAKYVALFELYGQIYDLDLRWLAAISVIESDSTHYRSDGSVVTSPADGYGNGRAIGMMQVKPLLWQHLARGADASSIDGNIHLGAAILRDGITTFGSWQEAIRKRYHPGTDPNSGATPDTYVRTMQSLIDEMEGAPMPVDKMVRFAGASIDVPLDVPFKIRLVPVGQKNQRPGIRMTPDRYVQHETDNIAAGAGAANQVQYLLNGAEGRQASWHLTVDDVECIQTIPLNEVAWHGGDGGGSCNYGGNSCELCVNMHGDSARMAKARANAEKVAAAAMLAMHVTKLVQHSDCCAAIGNPAGCHSLCPRYIRQDGYWPKFTANVQALMSGISPAPIVIYAPPMLVPGFDGSDKRIGNVTLYAAQRTYTAKRDDVPVLQYADPRAKPTRAPLKKGDSFTGWYVVRGGDGKDWIISTSSSRVPMEGLTPTVTVDPS